MKINQSQLHRTIIGRTCSRIVYLFIFVITLVCLPSSLSGARNEQKQSQEPVLLVKIGSVFTSIRLEFPNGGQIQNKRGRRVKAFKKKEVFNWSMPAKKGKRSKVQYSGETLTFSGAGNLLQLNGKPYRGAMQIDFSGNGAKVVNHVGIEDYLRGVVGSEIGSRSPAESLKAQTVIARTYAYASRGKHGSEGADVCDSTHCQVYSGASAERDTIDAAIQGTRGIIMISDGQPIATLYHASCGGMTSDNDKVFGGAPRSYLRRVVCPFCKDGTNYRWSKIISLKDLKTALLKEKITFARLHDVAIESAGPMDRVDNLVLTTDSGLHKVRGTTIRRLFNLPSTTFVTGSRKLPGQIIASAQPVRSNSATRTTQKARIMVVALMNDAEDGPQQLFVQTAAGLRRAARPQDGWHSIGRHLAKETQALEVKPTEQTKRGNPGNVSVSGFDKLEIFGRGYGHQVGLCQAGAIELGKREWSYRQILAFYYSNVALRSLDY